MGKKLEPEVQKHIHRDLKVTPERVRAFSKAKYAIRLQVLAALRQAAGDQTSSRELALGALAIALLTWIVKPGGVDPQGMHWLSLLVVVAILAGVVLVVIMPILIPTAIRLGRQDRARVWLAAYEDEIQRRASRQKK